MLNGKLALVTGASRGIGEAIAGALAANGARVVGTATSDAGALKVSQTLEPFGNGSCGRVLDVRDGLQIEALLAECETLFSSPVEILVNNAGITQDNIAVRMKESEWDSVIDTNLKSVFRLSKAVLRGMMKARSGRIINITSVVGSSGNAGQMNYAAAKAGIAGMSRSLAREIGSRNITVNCVAPGFIDTDMTKALGEGVHASLLAQIPLGRLGTPEDVAAAVTFLASPQAGYITGATLHVNGGMYMS
jgi:3-oxoacyl-[acyl-carrier protein] reductase